MRRLALAVVVVASLLALTNAKVAAADASSSRLHTEGRWLVDSAGRVVLLHGVNNVDKQPPYMELNDGFTVNARDAALLARHGFNTVRLGVEFAGLMPDRGRVDNAYLERIKTVVDTLGAAGMRVLVDNHQDSMSAVFGGGNGFPAWAVTPKPFPNEVDVGWPLNNGTMASLNLAWTNFWNNKQGVVTELGRAFAALGHKLKGDPAVLGYEVMNEPWPGIAYPTCIPLGCPAFDRRYQLVHQELTDRIHDGDPGALVFWEPHTMWNELIRTHLDEPPLTPKISDTSVVFSFHDYCAFSELANYAGSPPGLTRTCDTQHDISFQNFDVFSRRANLPAMVTEFGNNADPSVGDRTLVRADARFLGWYYWHYTSGFGPKGTAPDPFDGAFGREYVRTYPRATTGWPMTMHYDPGSGDFSYTYATRRFALPTEIYISDLQYPRGYRVTLRNACALSEPSDRLLLLRAKRGKKQVDVTISAGSAPWPAC